MLDSLKFLRKTHRRKTLNTVVEGVKRTTRLGNYWYWLQVPEFEEGVNIASLICPLRYDVIVRRDFYSFFVAHRDLYRSDFNAFIELAGQSPYYTWYVRSELVRTSPYFLDDPDSLRDRFAKQVRLAVQLYELMEENGFDRQYPIVLRTAEHLLPPTGDRRLPATGKVISDRYFMADGCHRLAYLMLTGCKVLPAEYLRVQCFREFSPFDSTSLLAQSLPISPADYFTFLSSRYCYPSIFEDHDSFLEYMKKHNPELITELLTVIRVDGFETDADCKRNGNEFS